MQTANNPDKLNNRITVKSLVFLEFIDETKAFLCKYLKNIRKRPGEFSIITFHPKVKEYLSRCGIYSMDSFNFCPTSSHQKLLVKLEEYTNDVRRNCNLTDHFGIKESYVENLLYSMRGILSHWLYRVEVIINAIEYYKPKAIISVGHKEANVARSLWVEPAERYITHIVSYVCVQRDIEFRNIPMRIKSGRARQILTGFWKELVKNISCPILQYTTCINKDFIMIPFIGHNMIAVINDFKRELGRDYEIVVLNLPFKSAARYFWRNIFTTDKLPYTYLPCHADKKQAFSENFIAQKENFQKTLFDLIDKWTYRDISPAPLLRLKYIHALDKVVINKTYYQAANMKRFLDDFQPILVLSQYSRGLGAVMGELCTTKQIASLMIPHGSFTAIPDKYSKLEWKENAIGIVDTQYQYLALQTPLIKDFLLDVPVKSEPIITGPLLFGRKNRSGCVIERLKQQFAPNGEILIIHASTPKHRKGQRLFNYETIDEYVDGLVSLVEAINNLKGVRLIIRYRVIDGLSAEELKNLLPGSNSYSIVSDGDFLDYLSIADVLVSFSSSTMEEALQNDIPVLVFNKYNRYRHLSGVALSPNSSGMRISAVYNVDSENDLLFALQWICDNHLSQKEDLSYLFTRYKYNNGCKVNLADFIKGLGEPQQNIMVN